MKINAKPPFYPTSFLAIEKDIETILRKLFVDTGEYSKDLVRLLVVNTPDCLTNKTSEVYKKAVESYSLGKLMREQYVRISPKITMAENEEFKSYIVISFDNFTENMTNPEFRDSQITFDVICPIKYWELGDYKLRPLKIIGYIDGILNKCRLSGIGTLQFLGASELIMSKDFAGYTLMYQAIHGSDDKIG